jgi:lipoprotein NlpI
MADGIVARWLESDENVVRSYTLRGEIYRDRKDYKGAIADCTEAIRLDPEFAPAYNTRGNAYSDMKDYDRAIADYSEAIRLDPNNASEFVSRGNAYYDLKDDVRAIADYTEAIRLDPGNTDAYASRGWINYMAGNYTIAASDLARGSAEQTQNYAYTVLWLYLARSRSGNKDASRELETNAAKLRRPVWPFPVVELFLGQRSPEATLAWPEKPDDRCEAQFYIGEWYLLRADRSAAMGPLQAAADTCPKDFIESQGAQAELKRLRN